MKRKSRGAVRSWLGLGAVAAATIFGGLAAGEASAAPSGVEFKMSCLGSNKIASIDRVISSSFDTDAPSEVKEGEEFTYRVQFGAQSYPDKESPVTMTNVSRLKLDFAIPSNASFVGASVVPGTGKNIDGKTPSVIRVNAAGAPDANGPILRLSGDNEVIGNSPNGRTDAEGGIRAPKLKKNLDGTINSKGESWFQLPAIDVTVRAGSEGTITPAVRTTGNAASYANNENFLTFLARGSAPIFGNQWAPSQCTPRDSKSAPLNQGADPLATIRVTK